MLERKRKLNNLKKSLKEMQRVLIAFSGGVDSTFLSKVAFDVLESDAVAVTAQSESYPKSEFRETKKLAKQIGIRHLIIRTNELNIKGFAENSPDRCYFCKKELFSKLIEIARKHNSDFVLDASNYDDLNDFRPGMKAARELNIRSPLMEAKLTKKEIRLLSKEMGLPTWDKPSMACLSSRFPYGSKITKEKLRMVEEGEGILKSIGLKQVRVRHHNEIARIEVNREEMNLLSKPILLEKIVNHFKKMGFNYVALDLQGYRSGSMNEVLKRK